MVYVNSLCYLMVLIDENLGSFLFHSTFITKSKLRSQPTCSLHVHNVRSLYWILSSSQSYTRRYRQILLSRTPMTGSRFPSTSMTTTHRALTPTSLTFGTCLTPTENVHSLGVIFSCVSSFQL